MYRKGKQENNGHLLNATTFNLHTEKVVITDYKTIRF